MEKYEYQAEINRLREENERLRNQLNGKWIPCSERLPDSELDKAIKTKGNNAVIPVLATIRKRKLNGEYYYSTGRAFYGVLEYDTERTFVDIEADKVNVIAWQPLPEPYIEKERE